MPGNELDVIRFLVSNLGMIYLNHLGTVNEVGAPASGGYTPITTIQQANAVVTEDARKKADIYINGVGVSIKQAGGSIPFNRIQRNSIYSIFQNLGFNDIENKMLLIDQEINDFHSDLLDSRNRPWQHFFSEIDFKALLHFLMMVGSPHFGVSRHQAQFILEAPLHINSINQLCLFSFEEYFHHYSDQFKIAIRRQWIGQDSTEHGRARGLARKQGNAPWVYEDVVGVPRSGWKENFPEDSKRTVYFLMIEKVRS